MKSPQEILHLEDNPFDTELICRHLSASFGECRIAAVTNEVEFIDRLKVGGVDIILSDYAVPGFEGRSALAYVREHWPHIPFLFVSGAIRDDEAVESLKAGATDYVLKDRLARLAPAILRALNEAEESARRKQAEERLRQSEEQYRDLFENASDMIQSVTPAGSFLYVNHCWRQTLGYSEDEVARLNIFDVVAPEYHEQYRRRFKTCEAEADSNPWETIFLTKTGQHLYVEGRFSSHACSGKPAAIRGIVRDVSEKKLASVAMKRALRKHQELVNSVDGIVWQASVPDLCFTFVSQQAERLLGYPVRCWLEEPQFWQKHLHPDDREMAVRLCSALVPEQKHKSFEYRMVAADGRVVWLRDFVSLRTDNGEAPQIQGIMVDISGRKRAEVKIRRIQQKLKQTNQDLTRKNDEIQNFYHTLSHELKTPLTSAREFISIVMDKLAGPLNETQSEYLGIAKESCNQLRDCINDMLDATRLDTGKLALALRPASIASLVQGVIVTMTSKANEKMIALRDEIQPDLPDIPVDEHRMIQIIANLVDNAIKYTAANGQIVVKVGDAPGCPGLLQVSVSDTGRGIPKEDQERVFDRLYQVKAGDAATEQGVGLGLYLCRELVRLHGGTICVESEPGKGSAFSFVVPKTEQSLHSNLLIIDDDIELLNMLREVLSSEEYNVSTACDGQEGLQELHRNVPDLVILDLAMPNLDGPATLQEIRSHWGSIPVIVLSGFTNGELMRRALPFSPFTLLAKPCTPGQVLETVRKVEREGETAFWKRNHHGMERPPVQ